MVNCRSDEFPAELKVTPAGSGLQNITTPMGFRFRARACKGLS